ncbi:MAG: hypothetical protein WA208_17310 [Thermoanaerobaculia bacterium]
MKILACTIIALLSVPVVSAVTVKEMLSQLSRRDSAPRSERFGAPRANVGMEFVDHDFVIPVAGNTPGNFGTHWKSEVVISNFRSQRQRIAVSILEQGKNSGTSEPVILELPSFEEEGELAIVTEDFMGYLGKTGLASIVVQAVQSDGKTIDEGAIIDGYSRIWTLQPQDPAQPCAPAQRGTVSQGMMTVTPDSVTGHEFPAFAVGLKQDETYRTNVGIVNLSPNQVTWLVEVVARGRAGTTFKMTVPGNSMIQQPIPAGIYGVMSIIFSVDDASLAKTPGAIESQHTGDGALLWNAYASSVDNRSGDGWTRQAAP